MSAILCDAHQLRCSPRLCEQSPLVSRNQPLHIWLSLLFKPSRIHWIDKKPNTETHFLLKNSIGVLSFNRTSLQFYTRRRLYYLSLGCCGIVCEGARTLAELLDNTLRGHEESLRRSSPPVDWMSFARFEIWTEFTFFLLLQLHKNLIKAVK